MKYIIIIALFLAGCSEPQTDLTSIWYGDSRCVKNEYLLSKDCTAGQKLIKLESIDSSYDVIIIHLGHNDAKNGPRGPVYFGERLELLIADFRGKVWCVLPTQINYYVEPHIVDAYRQEMIDRCGHYVDPQIEGYQEDRIHYTDYNYQQILEVYNQIMAYSGAT